MTRIAVGGIYHESNTFFSKPTTLDSFGDSHLQRGPEILDYWQGTCSEMEGFLKAAGHFGFDVVPTLMAWGMPSGTVSSEAFEALAGELVSRIATAAPLDGVLLSLHGAMVSERYEDADAEILRRVRGAITPKVPLIVTLDFHANLTEEMMLWPNAIVGYDTYPHVDQVERGFEAADILRRMLREGLRPEMALARRPMLPHILRQCTDCPPMSEVMAAVRRAERKPGLVSVSLTAGFPYADVSKAGLAVLAVGKRREKACAAAKSIADMVWDRRSDFVCEIPSTKDAVGQAIRQADGLTVLVDVGDNVGAGTPGDGTVLLGELKRQSAKGALVLLCDPQAVRRCLEAGVRQTITLDVGGKSDADHGEPISVTGVVRLLSDGIYRNVGAMRDGVLEDQGRTAVIETEGILIVLTERRMPMWNLQQLRNLGIEPAKLRIVVVKAAIAHRAAYAPIASRIIEVDTPGLSAADVRHFRYLRLQRPMYPLDPS